MSSTVRNFPDFKDIDFKQNFDVLIVKDVNRLAYIPGTVKVPDEDLIALLTVGCSKLLDSYYFVTYCETIKEDVLNFTLNNKDGKKLGLCIVDYNKKGVISDIKKAIVTIADFGTVEYQNTLEGGKRFILYKIEQEV